MNLDPPLWQILLAMAVGAGGAVLAVVCATILMFP